MYSEKSIEELVKSQRNFFKTGAPADLEHRHKQLLKLRFALRQASDELCASIYKDLRRDPRTTEVIELSAVFGEIDYMLKNLKNWSATTNVAKTQLTLLDTPQIVHEPKGTVLIIGPWNYPLSTLFLPLVAAIAAGNTVIVKPSELAPHTANAIHDALEPHFSSEFLLVIRGGADVTGELLKQHFDHILFTGSPAVGKVVLRAAAEHLTPVTLELGGKSPVIVEADADIDISARRIAWGKWLNNGQTCLAPDYILINADVKTRFLTAIRDALHSFYGDDVKHSHDYSRIINERHFNRLMKMLDKTEGKRVVSGEADIEDLFIPPTVLDEVTNEDSTMREEIFGPILPIITVQSLDEAIEFIKARDEHPLALYLFTRDDSKVKRVLAETISGSVAINEVLFQQAVDTLPFGGIGNSGMGRYRGKFGFDEFTHEKAVLKRGFFGERLTKSRYPPVTDAKIAELRRLTGRRIPIPSLFSGSFVAVSCAAIGAIVGWIAHRFLSGRRQ
jgi:aldehyde dehydrogenase (NAD+)